MLCERVYIDGEKNKNVFLDTYCAHTSHELTVENRPAMLILPGGGYAYCSDREAEPIADIFLAHGYNCFVLRYSVTGGDKNNKLINEHGIPRPLLQASLAMAHIKANKDKYKIDPDRISVIGFSAGAHLAASLGTLWYKDFIMEETGIEYGANKPYAMILSYPVISTDPSFAHMGSIENLLNGVADREKALEIYSLEKQVTDKTVPAFIWHTATDAGVPPKNSLALAQAMIDKNIPVELHIFPIGPHGLATSDRYTDILEKEHPHCRHTAQWKTLAINWLEDLMK